MPRTSRAALPVLLFAVACAAPPPGVDELRWTTLDTGTTASLRGLCVVDDEVVWASGSGGTVLRSLDGGDSWQRLAVPPPVPGGEPDDLRDIEALDAERAWVIGITGPARVLATADGGATWDVLHESPAAEAFYDSIALLRDAGAGAQAPVGALVYGDPHGGRFDVLRSADGRHFERLAADRLPAPREGEAGFAASGTCVVTHGALHAWIATGGLAARVLRSTDGGHSWSAAEVPVRQGTPTSGLYGVAFRDARHGVVVGGAYDAPDRGGDNAAWSADGGVTWTRADPAPEGYRSCAVWLPGPTPRVLAVGRGGASLSADGGRSWATLADDTGFYAADVAPDGTVIAVGADGRAGRLEPGVH